MKQHLDKPNCIQLSQLAPECRSRTSEWVATGSSICHYIRGSL